ncbi:MAG: type IV/VI secretion system ImpK/VasF family protein [Planctomycetota bacterium]|jgi:type IV/VI secretion system ImpK/VasF family protein
MPDRGELHGAGEREEQQRLIQACAPIFLHLVTFRRNAATSQNSVSSVQAALIAEIDGVRDQCDMDRRLRPLFDRIFYGVVATADQIILSSAWTQKPAWSMKLLETHYFQTAEAGHRFYVLVDEILNDPLPEAAELAEVLFTCMALGFQGELLGERRELERRRRELFDKARLGGASGEAMTPDAYGRNTVREIRRLPTVGILRLVVVALGALIFSMIASNEAVEIRDGDYLEAIEKHLETIEERSDSR